LKDDESDSIEEHESKSKETHTLVLRRLVQERRKLKRYTPPDFCSNFDLFIINDDPIIIREAMYSKDGKL
jgi:hypothetical protein